MKDYKVIRCIGPCCENQGYIDTLLARIDALECCLVDITQNATFMGQTAARNAYFVDAAFINKVTALLEGGVMVHPFESHPKEVCESLVNCPYCEIHRLQARIEALTEKYNELLYQVQNKIPGESRHETAKRIIAQHESRRCGEGGETKMEVE